MSSHTFRPLEPEIEGVFYRAGYIERRGRGIQKICDACKSIGADEPEYIVHGGKRLDIGVFSNKIQQVGFAGRGDEISDMKKE